MDCSGCCGRGDERRLLKEGGECWWGANSEVGHPVRRAVEGKEKQERRWCYLCSPSSPFLLSPTSPSIRLKSLPHSSPFLPSVIFVSPSSLRSSIPPHLTPPPLTAGEGSEEQRMLRTRGEEDWKSVGENGVGQQTLKQRTQ
ncbi:hypothetical protein CLOM_g6425 [Closterium sp. NIES-68]|nr:hypothetical protein CLOM_g6425 [Closterium sp. NIES-68]GJP71189.1 hypothetical protein CLOP_g2034 [Closterium sp. NIES-67]